MDFEIRPATPDDLPALYRICLCTGDAGRDASALYRDPELLGHYYAAPYARVEPGLGFMLTRASEPVGYVLGTRDTIAFNARAERDWFPPLRRRLPLPKTGDESADGRMLRLIHAGYTLEPAVAAYPAHLHIDLLPVAQGQGQGRRLLERFIDALREAGSPAVHLGVDERNVGAIAFYERTGFHCLGVFPGWRAYGRKLTPAPRADA